MHFTLYCNTHTQHPQNSPNTLTVRGNQWQMAIIMQPVQQSGARG